ncbi:hypothetical protein BKA56DRAFT_620530 [Ilyonectria sp. MPI-CAGE-AT-0026]|nr:hypothetical protein BKA56DRAFT_620530 [Ilyonectria sp. MPI-CAGE-AT-0026]
MDGDSVGGVFSSSRLLVSLSQYRPLLVPPRHHAKLGTPRPVDRPVIRRGPDSSGALARSLTFAPPTAAQPMAWSMEHGVMDHTGALVALGCPCGPLLARPPPTLGQAIYRSPRLAIQVSAHHPVGGYALIEYITRDSPHHCHLRTTDRLISLDSQRLFDKQPPP